MKRSCVVGWPVEHSRSPLIHNYWLKSLGIDGAYTKEEVHPKDLQQFLKSLQNRGYLGCNITIPHKEAALTLVDFKDKAATQIGAINTVWIEDNKLCATNTDATGFITYLDKQASRWRNQDAPIVILGAGGAAKAIVYAFLENGIDRIHIYNRTLSRGEELAAHFGSKVRIFPWSEREKGSSFCSVLVNTTSIGMKGQGDIGINFKNFSSNVIVCDIVYVPLETNFIKDAKQHGLCTVDGLGMLLHQAVPGFEKWFGFRPKVTDALFQIVTEDIKKH